MSQTIDTKGATMEAHAGTITIGRTARPRSRRLAELMASIRRRRIQQAERAYSLRANGAAIRSLSGSEHTHLIRRPRGF